MSEKISHWAWVGMKYRPLTKRDTRKLIEDLCESLGYTLAQATERTRRKHIVQIRQQIMYVIRQRDKNASLAIIGEILNLDHTTVIHGLKSAQNHILTEPDYRQTVEKLMMV